MLAALWPRAIFLFFLVGACLCAPASAVFAAETKKKIKYQSHTQVDFSGQAVEGKIRAPEIFYIFQRKRSTAQKAADAPSDFNEHRQATIDVAKGALPK